MPAADWLAVALVVVAVGAPERFHGPVDLTLKRVFVDSFCLLVTRARGAWRQGRGVGVRGVRRGVDVVGVALEARRAAATGGATTDVDVRARDEQAVSVVHARTGGTV